MQVVNVLVFLADEPGDRLLNQRGPGDAQQRDAGEVGLQNSPLVGDDEVAHGRQVVQVEIALPSRGQLGLHPA